MRILIITIFALAPFNYLKKIKQLVALTWKAHYYNLYINVKMRKYELIIEKFIFITI